MENPSDYIESDIHFKINHKITGATATTFPITLNTLPAQFGGLCKIYLRSVVIENNTMTAPLVQIDLGVSQPFSQSSMVSSVASPNLTIANLYFIDDTANNIGWSSLTDQSIVANIYPNQQIGVTIRDNSGASVNAFTTLWMILDIVPLKRREGRWDTVKSSIIQ